MSRLSIPKLSMTPTPWSTTDPTGEYMVAAMALVAGKCSVVNWMDGVDWAFAGTPMSKAARGRAVIDSLMAPYELDVLVQIDVRNIDDLPGGPGTWRFYDRAIRDRYLAHVEQVLQLNTTCRFCNLAMEVDWAHERVDWVALIDLVHEAFYRFRGRFPDVEFGVSFQFENIVNMSSWGDLALFEELDIVLLTTYPQTSQAYQDPMAIPQALYEQLSQFTANPIGFAEFGYSVDPQFGGSVERQEQFVVRLLGEMTANMDCPIINSQFCWDTESDISLFRKMGPAGRPAYMAYEIAE